MRRRSIALLPVFALLLAVAPERAGAPPEDLLGRPFAAALARYGPPDSGSGTGELVQWRWRTGGELALVLGVHDGVVVAVDSRLPNVAIGTRELPAKGFYTGQPVGELLARLGNPDRAVGKPLADSGPHHAPHVLADLLLVFGSERILVSGGHVIGVQPPAATVHGPRTAAAATPR